MFSQGSKGAGVTAAAAIMFIIGLLFGISAAINMVILLKVVFSLTFTIYYINTVCHFYCFYSD